MLLACYIPIDFNHDSICGLTKAQWKAGTNNWDWVSCPACIERRPTPNVADGLPAGHHGSSLECTHPFCVAEREEMRRS